MPQDTEPGRSLGEGLKERLKKLIDEAVEELVDLVTPQPAEVPVPARPPRGR